MLGAAGCAADASFGAAPDAAVGTDAALTRVSAYGVSALVPPDWIARPSDDTSAYLGLTASPGPGGAGAQMLPNQGLLATRIDAAEIGAPSDFYYLAAKGPVLAGVTDEAGCHITTQRVIVDHRPSWLEGRPRSPGDFVATGSGECRRHGTTTRWSYFVAAPGYGPASATGIPGSGLYLILASMPASPGALRTLDRMIRDVRFGTAGTRDFVHAVQMS